MRRPGRRSGPIRGGAWTLVFVEMRSASAGLFQPRGCRHGPERVSQQGGIVLRVVQQRASEQPAQLRSQPQTDTKEQSPTLIWQLCKNSTGSPQRLSLEAHLDRIPSPNPCLVCLARERQLFTRSSGAAVFLGSGLRF